MAICINDEEYTNVQIYNCDETTQKGGLKLYKEIITVLICVNKAGNHKLTPLISKSQSPRCFKSMNIKSRPVQYKNRANAGFTRPLFPPCKDF